jgi:nucleoside-diphosphate-sugar epimerase
MIIGSGLLGSGFLKMAEDFEDCVIFTSGVSDSKETDIKEFDRERDLILKVLSRANVGVGLKFIYFSSILAGEIDNPYYNHNVEMEELVKSKSKNYIIFKLPQIIGELGNKNNLINYLKYNIKNFNNITIYKNVKRSIIDVDDIVKLVKYCKDKVNKEVINISDIEKIQITDLVYRIAEILTHNKVFMKVNFTEVSENWTTENSEIINEAIKALKIDKKGYTLKVLKKYIK